MTKKQKRTLMMVLLAWPAVWLMEVLFYGITGMPLFAPSEKAGWARAILALAFGFMAVVAGNEIQTKDK